MPNDLKRPCGCGEVSQRANAKPEDMDGGLNSVCHGFLGGVNAHQSHVMPNPKIVLIYWDQYFTDTPDAVTSMDQFVSDMATGNHWPGLGQYGVGSASLQGHVVIDMKTYPTPNTSNPGKSFSESQMQTQLITWLDDKVVSPKPAGDELNLIYLIIAPSDTTLSNGNLTSASFCGYHDHGQYSATTTRDNLIWGTVTGYTKAKTGQAFVDSISFCVSHELTEAFPNPDGNGFYNQVDVRCMRDKRHLRSRQKFRHHHHGPLHDLAGRAVLVQPGRQIHLRSGDPVVVQRKQHRLRRPDR
jgi:hypothetical protein